jgi:Prokaryotic RING finger family 1
MQALPLLIVGLVVLTIYIALRLMTNFSAWMTGARHRAYRQLAARYHGRFETRGLSDPPTVSFTHRGSTVRVGLAPTIVGQPGQIPRTRVVARFSQGIPFRMELAPAARPAPPQSPKGTRLVTTKDPKFDLEFVARANDAEMARDFLTLPVRSTVVSLQQVVHPGGMLVSINPERMLLQIDRNLGTNAESLAWVVAQALTLHDGLIDGVARRIGQGVEIVDDPESWQEDQGAPTCKVCGDPIDESEIVVCASCNTPHHLACWEYADGCSIFGCKGKSFMRA